jgi:DNA polymerase-3 subunit gamma/tau
LEINNQCDLNYKITGNKRLLQELTLMKICALNNAPPPQESAKKEPAPEPVKKEETVVNNAVPQKNETPVENPAPTTASIPKTGLPPTSISIKKAAPKEDAAQQSQEILNASFSQEKLNEVWQEMAKNVKTESIRIAFQARNPVLKENNRIVLEVENKILESQINDILVNLKPYLAKKLNNNQFNFDIVVMQREEADRTPYTDEEKVQDMKKRNPALNDFMENLDLQVQ